MRRKVSSEHFLWLLFLVQPLFATAVAIKNFEFKFSKNIIWAFSVFFGFTFAISEESGGSDIHFYITELENFYRASISFKEAVIHYNQSGEIDVLRILIAYLLSTFTDSQIILTSVYGFILGYFFSRNMWFVFDRIRYPMSFMVILLMTCLFLITPIWEINGFRFNTAIHVFLFGLLPYLFEKKKQSLIFCFITPFVFHFSFVIPAGILLVYLLLGNKLHFYYYFFVATLMVSEINYEFLNQLIDTYLPQDFVKRSAGYRTEESIESFTSDDQTGVVWYAKYYMKALNISLIVFLIYLYWKIRKFKTIDFPLYRLASFTFLFFGVANILKFIPSGGRFIAIASLLALALIILYLDRIKSDATLKRLINLAYPAIFLFIVISVRDGFYFLSVTTLLANPIIAIFFPGYNMALNDIIK